LDPLHTLLAIALELPEDYFTRVHKYEVKGEDYLRYMMYRKYTSQEYAKLGEVIFRGHTDLGSWSLLFRQPVAGLQIKDHSTNEWKWAKPQEGAIIVNAGDTLSLLTAGYVKSNIHRVTIPPKDQQHVDRHCVLYFSRAQNHLRLSTIAESPVLQREGFTHNKFEASGNPVPTMEGVKPKL
jgi:isopenicillin N synthase-like dioxygenase